jgi:hypothetical protein
MASDGVSENAVTFYLVHPNIKGITEDPSRPGWFLLTDCRGDRCTVTLDVLRALRYKAALVVRAYGGRVTVEELLPNLGNGAVIGEYGLGRAEDLRLLNDPPASGPGARVERK